MNMSKRQYCQECRSALVDDAHNGELICTGCGMVIEGQRLNYGPEIIGGSYEESINLSRATGHNTYAQHDLGVRTEIGSSVRDFSGKHIDGKIARQMDKLRDWHKWIRVSNTQERRLATVLSRMYSAVEVLGLTQNVLETASILYRNIDNHVDIKGKSLDAISTATLYMACKQCDVVRSIEEIGRAVNQTKIPNTKLASRYYRKFMMDMGQINIPVTADKYISKFANMAQMDAKVERLALEMAKGVKSATITDGKTPNGTAAAYLYMASVILGYDLPQREISTVSNVTEVTIRNRCKVILTNHKIKIVLQPVRATK